MRRHSLEKASFGDKSINVRADITQLLEAWRNGDPAAWEQLAPVVHRELHQIAARHMAGEREGHVLQTTALMNEAYLRLVDRKDAAWQNRAHFFGMASRVMRHILVDAARARRRSKRGGGGLLVSLSDAADVEVATGADIVALNDALTALEEVNPRHGRVVELRFFGGLSIEEAAHVLAVSVGTVQRDWRFARAWLYRELNRKG